MGVKWTSVGEAIKFFIQRALDSGFPDNDLQIAEWLKDYVRIRREMKRDVLEEGLAHIQGTMEIVEGYLAVKPELGMDLVIDRLGSLERVYRRLLWEMREEETMVQPKRSGEPIEITNITVLSELSFPYDDKPKSRPSGC